MDGASLTRVACVQLREIWVVASVQVKHKQQQEMKQLWNERRRFTRWKDEATEMSVTHSISNNQRQFLLTGRLNACYIQQRQ